MLESEFRVCVLDLGLFRVSGKGSDYFGLDPASGSEYKVSRSALRIITVPSHGNY